MKEHLHGWLFQYNIYTDKWDATTKDNYVSLVNEKNNGVISSHDLWELIEIIKVSGKNIKIQKTITHENY